MKEATYNMAYSNLTRQCDDWLMDKQKIRRIVEANLRPEGRILEIGCNRGDFVRHFQQFSEAYGIGINKEAVRAKVTENILLQDATKTDFPDDYFERIYSTHAIEHIGRADLLFKEIERILKRGGRVVLVYPWELFRGMFALRTAWQMRVSPRTLHKIKYSPGKIKGIIRDMELRHIYSRLFFARTPQWLTVLQRG